MWSSAVYDMYDQLTICILGVIVFQMEEAIQRSAAVLC